MDIRKEKNTLFLIPDSDFTAGRIESLRNEFLEALNTHPDASTVVLQANRVETVDSLGVNLIIGIFRQVTGESKSFQITGAGPVLLKLAAFFQLTKLFTISGRGQAQ